LRGLDVDQNTNIIEIGGVTRLDLPADRILDAAAKGVIFEK